MKHGLNLPHNITSNWKFFLHINNTITLYNELLQYTVKAVLRSRSCPEPSYSGLSRIRPKKDCSGSGYTEERKQNGQVLNIFIKFTI